ncbi:hypothetical protein BDF20DRAFT_845716 [Mycotypha africana]|uniref:uncharacterized protein n=1 Tax=Mycotypha africana TaxID=64632 RepID=UPI0023008B1E|nr:uncharacterized protein BDF20DRAFT_845716 [Mycotypha africana]KAI8991655.1 hypothetical protein BDF20DRAFT_845716 [Mycotypha africana]
MSPLQVISASFLSPESKNLQKALDILGYNCHDINHLHQHPENCEAFYKVHTNREEADWDNLYDGFDAAVDWPASYFYKELLFRYPTTAKVIIIEKEPDEWYESVKDILPRIKEKIQQHNNASSVSNDHKNTFHQLMKAVILNGYFNDQKEAGDNRSEEERIKQVYQDHLVELKKVIPVEHLHIMRTDDGWEELCKFLGKEIPDIPYPNTFTKTDDFLAKLDLLTK